MNLKKKKIYNILYIMLFCGKTIIHIILILLVLVGAFNWGTTAYGYNLVEIFSNYLNNLLSTNIDYHNYIYVIVALAAVILALNRDTWLPFLGKTVLPGSRLELYTPPNANKVVLVNVKPNSKVIYWASLGNSENQNVETAYNKYENSGVVMSDNNGVASLLIMEGYGYNTNIGHINKHIHYRVCYDHGMMSKVNIIYY